MKNTPKQSIARLSFLPILILFSPFAVSDDTDIFNTQSATPKMLFVLDASGSMGRKDGLASSRMERMKEALRILLADIENIDIGLMRFSKPVGGGPEVELIHPIVDIGRNRDSLQVAAKNIPLGRLTGGGTPSVAALHEAQRYFSGSLPYRGGTTGGAARYVSPTTSQCESNHIVLLTDGQPTPDTQAVQDLDALYGPCVAEPGGRGTCGVELSKSIASVDQIPDLPGNNTITTHSIGFNIVDDWVKDVAAAGQGEYRDAVSAVELVTAFEGIIDASVQATVASAPAMPVSAFNESRHSDELYYSFFQSSRLPRWEGNIKKYRLVNGVIVDRYDRPLVVAGDVEPTSTSLWSNISDGESVQAGGMAAKHGVDRNWYTDAGVAPSIDGAIRPRRIRSAGEIAPSYFGASSVAERDTLVNWVLGEDSIDRDRDGDKLEPNNYIADSLHGSPVLATYHSKRSTNELDQVLFTATNMGALHAVDPETGDNLWSYTPEELLENIKHYVDNTSSSHVYGLDGQMVLHTIQKASTIYDQEISKAHLYLSQRRGGSSIFGVDVTNARHPTNPLRVMWKIKGGVAGSDYRNLAQSWSTPQIVPIRYGCPDACTTREALLFSGGYNPIYDNEDLIFPVSPAETGHGNAIYLVDPETGELLWSAGHGLHHDLNLPIKDSVPAAPVPVDTDADGAVNLLFFSDIAGHVWRVDLDPNAPDLGGLAIDGGMIAQLNEPAHKLRFFNQPDVVVIGTTNQTAKFSVVLGSGIRSSPLMVETQNNRLFSFTDPWVFTNPVGEEAGAEPGSFKPEYRYIINQDGSRRVITTDVLKQYDGTNEVSELDYGFFRVLEPGEKILERTLTHAGKIFFTSYAPPDAATASMSCDAFLGESRLYILDLLKGTNKLAGTVGNPYVTVGIGIAPDKAIVDTGGVDGPELVIGTNVISLDVLLDGNQPNTFRRIRRTGWSELED